MSTAASPTRKEKIWTEEEYLNLPGGKLVEFDHGQVEVLPMPTPQHQKIVFRLQKALDEFVETRNLGDVLAAPLPVKVGARKYREPDVMFRRSSNLELDDPATKFWDRVELVAEVMSDGSKNRDRDLVVKRREYAAAGISEYWIIDLEAEEMTVLNLEGSDYLESGRYRIGDTARSVVLPGFEIAVQTVIAPKK